jgi:tRNA pseudouridine32 synthase/23S rRNA pseudouridine746 synthase
MNDSPPLIYAPPLEPFLTVLHVDRDILVLSKPSGLLSVPGKDPALSDCARHRAQARHPGALTVHRLDLQTSGILLMAMTPRAQSILGKQFQNRQVTKSYVARVAGAPAETGRIDAPICADWQNRPRQRIDRAQGRPSVTEWTLIAREGAASRLRLIPVTGRTHQLRVHLESIGCPILGDPLYGDAESRAAAPRLQLHAETLGFRHPADGRPVTFHDPCPF